MAVYVLTMSVH